MRIYCRLPPEIAPVVCAYLRGLSRFHLATVARLRPAQMQAYCDAYPFALDTATARGGLELLDLLRDHYTLLSPPRYSAAALAHASRAGSVALLRWWHERSGLKLVYNRTALDNASALGHLPVLQWWMDSGLTLRYSCLAVDLASENGHVHVLDWWARAAPAPPLPYTTDAVDDASARGEVGVLQWWKDSGHPLKYTDRAVDDASAAGCVASLQWWRDSGLALKYSQKAVNRASAEGHVAVLRWWRDCSGLPLKYGLAAVDSASENGRVDTLRWWRDSGLELKFTQWSIHSVPRPVVAWWKENCPDAKRLRVEQWIRERLDDGSDLEDDSEWESDD
ncbi:hypothetical protein DFJ73DRAFT_663126 [Zopfochytrium polystomum]|nr:hypothetical protein DFJ73DRAFT_663126 [Zopfochytrium polystomum]